MVAREDLMLWTDVGPGGKVRALRGGPAGPPCGVLPGPRSPEGGLPVGCAPDLLLNSRVRREALRQLDLAAVDDDDAKLPSVEQLALAALDRLADEASPTVSD